MIATRDLPVPVRRAVAENVSPATLRVEAQRRIGAGLELFSSGEWPAVVELLGLAIGYLVGAARVEEGA